MQVHLIRTESGIRIVSLSLALSVEQMLQTRLAERVLAMQSARTLSRRLLVVDSQTDLARQLVVVTTAAAIPLLLLLLAIHLIAHHCRTHGPAVTIPSRIDHTVFTLPLCRNSPSLTVTVLTCTVLARAGAVWAYTQRLADHRAYARPLLVLLLATRLNDVVILLCSAVALCVLPVRLSPMGSQPEQENQSINQ